jgi:dienelactone hydrolase
MLRLATAVIQQDTGSPILWKHSLRPDRLPSRGSSVTARLQYIMNTFKCAHRIGELRHSQRPQHFSRCLIVLVHALLATSIPAQPYGEPDRGQPGDEMIQDYLRHETSRIESSFSNDLISLKSWTQLRPRYLEEFYDMLGLSPLPEKTPLRATVTRTLDRGDYTVEMLHYQSRPGLYVTANLYRPAKIDPGARLPAILYVCGHSPRGRDGNKVAFQSHGVWFARHGYLCLVVDTLQLGEIPGLHHGTYRENRWWWLSRGYTPAGVECWNGIRGIDYLVSRPDVDPERIGVTGISGGGAATFWIAAADERVKVAVPVSGMADLASYVSNRVINGHCDCMFLYNTHQWPWTRIAALIAPRPMLFVNSDQDAIFPMDANERVGNRLERVYSLFGAADLVDSFISIGGHDYRQDIRQATYRFFNVHLKNDPRLVTDSEVDLVTGSSAAAHPIPPETLRVFPGDSDLPTDAINARIDEEFIPVAAADLPGKGEFDPWKQALLDGLRRSSFHHFPERIPAATPAANDKPKALRVMTEPGITLRLRSARAASERIERILLLVIEAERSDSVPEWLERYVSPRDSVYVLEPRGVGDTSWSRRNPPNYVERAHVLLGRTVDSGRVWDVAAVARYLGTHGGVNVPVHLAGQGPSAALAVYAGLMEPGIAGFLLHDPPASLVNAHAPVFLNVLRICDLPDAMAMLAPRPVTLSGRTGDWTTRVAAVYQSAEAEDQFDVRP